MSVGQPSVAPRPDRPAELRALRQENAGVFQPGLGWPSREQVEAATGVHFVIPRGGVNCSAPVPRGQPQALASAVPTQVALQARPGPRRELRGLDGGRARNGLRCMGSIPAQLGPNRSDRKSETAPRSLRQGEAGRSSEVREAERTCRRGRHGRCTGRGLQGLPRRSAVSQSTLPMSLADRIGSLSPSRVVQTRSCPLDIGKPLRSPHEARLSRQQCAPASFGHA